MSSTTPFSVSQLTRRIKALLEDNLGRVAVQGEVSSLSRPGSGHQYFTLKDESSQISAVLFKGSAAKLPFMLEEGLEVVCHGRISVYEPRGSYQLIVERVEPVGAGALQFAFEQLKAKLAAEGLFAAERKQPLPPYPTKIGIVTSPTGAALQDMLNVLARRCPAVPVLIAPSLVQGESACQMLAFQLQTMDQRGDLDVIIIGRGGGSLEDLWSFNEELLVRAVAACKTPVISAVGHETDFTLCDFAADLRAPTPSAAAELAVPLQEEMLALLQRQQTRLQRRMLTLLNQYRTSLQHTRKRLRDPAFVIQAQAQRVDEATMALKEQVRQVCDEAKNRLYALEQRLQRKSPQLTLQRLAALQQALEARLQAAAKTRLGQGQQRLSLLAGRLNSLSPLAVLQRGYSLAQNPAGRVISRAEGLAPGDLVHLRFSDGQVLTRVETKPNPSS